MKYARIQDNRCAEFITFDPTDKFHPSIQWVLVPVELETLVDYTWELAEDGQTLQPSDMELVKDRIKAQIAAVSL
jgi:hypothetical protein